MKAFTLTLGKTADQYRKAFKKGDIQLSSRGEDLLSKMPVGKKEKVEVGIMTVRDLGFTTYTTTTELFTRIKEKGYDLCLAEVGPALRLAYTNQPVGQWLYVAMEQIIDSDGHPDVFSVERDVGGERWLRSLWVSPDSKWDLGHELVFRLRKSSGLEPSEKPLDTLPLELTINGLVYRRG
jgi:hypothetical protein